MAGRGRAGPSTGRRSPPAGPVAGLLDSLTSSRALSGAVAWRGSLPGAPAEWGDPPHPLPRNLSAALEAASIGRLWSHQAAALEALDRGGHVLTVTPTASGKSLIYVLSTLEAIERDPRARALYLFPFKALEQDQLASLRAFIASAGMEGRVRAAVYDGDTPPAERRRLRARPPEILITNPDMLHMGLLAYHPQWSGFFAGLRYVVVDELHVYRGVFGSHFHHVMRRLARVCRAHGSSPRFIVSSATVGNPAEFASMLLGVDVRVVERSGAPRSPRHFLFVNPPSGSPYTAAAALMEACVRAGMRTIAFTKARTITELLASWLAGAAPDLAGRIASYRAGYLPEDRRAIEARLSRGDLLGVVSTSALEHGIDVGGLDACLLVGYPGSIASAWQRAGRVGRAGRESLVALVALPDALDQYFMRNPEEFFGRGFERAAADPENPVVAARHLVCAGAEIPITEADRAIYPPSAFGLVEALARDGGLVADASTTAWYSLRRRPQRDFGLRAAGEAYAIVEEATSRAIGTVDGVRAFTECHEGALYLHQGQQYEVVELDRVKRRVTARRVERNDYTQVMSEKETEILEVLAARSTRGLSVSLGRLRVTQEFKEYVRRRMSDQARISVHPLDLPPVVFETVGLWWEIPDALGQEAVRRAHHFTGSLHAAEHAAISLIPLLVLCDRNDLGGISYAAHPQTGGAAVFVYDGHAGGIGLAAQGYERIEELLGRTRDLLACCPCAEGCPSCVHSPKCGSGNHPLDKAGARFVLEALLAGGATPAAGDRRPVAVTLRPPGLPEAGRRPAGAGTERTSGRQSGPRLLFFDLETRRSAEEVGGWNRISAMGLALAVVYDAASGEFRTYYEQDVDRLIVELLSADRVVGFNLKRFDYEVLRGYREAAFDRIPTCDLLEEIHRKLGFRLSLDHLARETPGEGKSADGLQSIRWFKEGRLDLVESYCRRDVEVTRRLYEFGRSHGYLLYRDHAQRSVRLPVDW